MKFRRKRRENWDNWGIPKSVIVQIRKEFRRSRARYGIAFLFLVAIVSYGFWDASQSRLLFCHRENETRAALTSIVNKFIEDRTAVYNRHRISSHQYEHEIDTFSYAKRQLQLRSCNRELFITRWK